MVSCMHKGSSSTALRCASQAQHISCMGHASSFTAWMQSCRGIELASHLVSGCGTADGRSNTRDGGRSPHSHTASTSSGRSDELASIERHYGLLREDYGCYEL